MSHIEINKPPVPIPRKKPTPPLFQELGLLLNNKDELGFDPNEIEDVEVKIIRKKPILNRQTGSQPNQTHLNSRSGGAIPATDLITSWQVKVRRDLENNRNEMITKKKHNTFQRVSRAFSHLRHTQQTTSYQLQGMEKEELFQILFHLFDRKQQGFFSQYQWIEFLKVRLIGIGPDRDERWVGFVKLVESVTFTVCGNENVDFEKFRKIFGNKDVLTKFFRLLDHECRDVVTAHQIMDFISNLMKSPWSKSRLNENGVRRLEKLFREVVGNGDFIGKEDFKKIIKAKNEFFVDRVFDIFNESGSGYISLDEFIAAMHQFASGQDPDAKIRFLFKVYDADNDGLIRVEDLGTVIRACMVENGMKFSDAQTDELTKALFEDADTERKGALTFNALKSQLEKHPGLLENMSLMLDQYLVPPEKTKKKSSINAPHELSSNYIRNNFLYLFWYHLLLITNIALFSTRVVFFRKSHPNVTIYLVLARGAGQCLNFNCAFVVVLMLRQSLTFLRSRGASSFLPIDKHIKFHKITGKLIFFFGVLHTIMHLINIAVGILPSAKINSGNWNYFEFLFNPKTSSQEGIFSLGLIPGYAFNTGVVLTAVLTIMVLGSLPCVRKGGCFEIFYWTHLLYYVFWALLIVHAPKFWIWFSIPGGIFLIEQVLRIYNWKLGRGHTWVSSGILLPSRVTNVVIKRPPNFDYHPGDYVFVRIPKIAKCEWHPFTISSAPEQKDEIWLHVRACGQWTTKLYEYFGKQQEKIKSKSVVNPTPGLAKPIQTNFTGYAQMKNQQIQKASSRSASHFEMNTVRRNKGECVRHTTIGGTHKYVRNKPNRISFHVATLQNVGSSLIQNDVEAGNNEETQEIGEPLEIFLDGPYGAPSSHIFRAEHAVLIGTGIGVTPFASILQSIMHRYWASRTTCPNCSFKTCGELSQSIMDLKKVDFFWINRDQKCFEWFVQLLSQLEIEQAESGVMERFLDMHMYITSALQRTDMKAVGLQLALDLLHEKEKRDLLTGLKTRTIAGRPNWNKIFQQITDQKKGKVTVFYCGPPALSQTLRLKCDEFGFTFRKENF